MPSIRNYELSFADSPETIEDNSPIGAITAKYYIDFRKLPLSCRKMFGFIKFREAKANRKHFFSINANYKGVFIIIAILTI